MKTIISTVTIFILSSLIIRGDILTGTFGNMNFEADLLPYEGSEEYLDPAGLSWSFGNTNVFHNYWLPPGDVDVEEYVFIRGTFPSGTAFMMHPSYHATNSFAGIYQTGEIPTSANSIQLEYLMGEATPQIYLNEIEIPLFEIQSGVLAGDIQSWEGQTVKLEVRLYDINPPNSANPVYTHAVIDNIGFSTNVVPEPSTIGLFGCSIISLYLYRSKKRCRTRTWTLS